MKVAIVLTAILAVACCQNSPPDPQALLKDEPRLAEFITCMQGKDTCEPFASQLRAQLPEALKTSCAVCPIDLKTFVRVVSLALMKDHAEEYKKIEDYFDKERKYEKTFNEFLHASD